MGNKKVVVINNDAKSLGDLEEIIAASGHEAVMVDDVFLAVDAVVKSEPDVILLELKMPHKNGFELANEIRHAIDADRVPIIAMSSFFKDEFRSLFNLCGIDGHLKVPFNPLDVIWAIENVTGDKENRITREGLWARPSD